MNIMFIGDSITDVGRNAIVGGLGQGYPLLVAARLGMQQPGEYRFDNKGISGSRIVDLYARIKTDVWNVAPDLVSILIGVNDVWHDVGDTPNGVEADRFEAVYRMLLQDTKKRLPNVRFILLEPFVLPGTATEGAWEIFRSEVALRAEAVRRLAAEQGAVFVPLQNSFDSACEVQSAAYWLGDGVHPTPAGHQLIADAWLKTFAEKLWYSQLNWMAKRYI